MKTWSIIHRSTALLYLFIYLFLFNFHLLRVGSICSLGRVLLLRLDNNNVSPDMTKVTVWQTQLFMDPSNVLKDIRHKIKKKNSA